MQRRTFIKNTAISAVAVSAFGFIRFDGGRYTGDCETTTDILGPYYRPGSPLRNNLLIAGEKGTLAELSGIVKHHDCVSPYKNAKVELWHCDNRGIYDNESKDFKYRGTTYTDESGRYSFQTILPVAYGSGEIIRPAHYHLMITAEGYQPLVTQLYFAGDPKIVLDAAAKSPASKNRILKVQTLKDGSKKVLYDVSMAQTLAVEAAAIDKLTGTYTAVKDPKNKKELFRKENGLWMKNEVFGEMYVYKGNNTFEYPGMPAGSYGLLKFELLASGGVRLTIKEAYGKLVVPETEYTRDV